MTLEHKKGSMIYMMMILILCSTFLIRNHRLFRSHIYLERGIYSMDVRVHEFNVSLKFIEASLNARFVNAEEFLVYIRSGRNISIDIFTITYDSSYNKDGTDMILVLDKSLNYLRKVKVIEEDGQLKLISKGV